jgi:hypothetical protein
MASSLDVNVLPLYRRDGYEQVTHPGLRVANAPRRVARGRRTDRLVILVTFQGKVGVSPKQQTELLDRLEDGYYQTSGTVTNALRSLAESLNELLLKRNQRGVRRDHQIVAHMSMVVLRDNHMFLAQSGTWHAFLMTAETIDHFYDPEVAGRGLGLSKKAPVRFFQADLSPSSLLVITPKLPENWKAATLDGAFGQSLSTLRRRFLGQAGPDLEAVVLEARKGKGKMNLVRISAVEETSEPRTTAATEEPEPAAAPPSPEIEHKPWDPADEAQTVAPPPPIPEGAAVSDSVTDEVEMTSQPAPGKLDRRRRRRKESRFSTIMGEIGGRVSAVLKLISEKLRDLLVRILPGEDLLTIPTSVMVFTAIAVPVVLVTIAAVVYNKVGRERQFQSVFLQAQGAAEQAVTQTEYVDIRTSWETALYYLDQADVYQVTDESQALRAQATGVLDRMDYIERLDFQPAIAGTLGGPVDIQRIVVTGTGLYMLDASRGAVMRAWKTGTGYEIDPDFVCESGNYNDYIVSSLVDIAALPAENVDDVPIVAMDGNGNLLFCSPDGLPPVAVPLVPPDNNWGSPMALATEKNHLYVLDPLTNAVWRYSRDQGQYSEPPRFFFGNVVPSMTGVLDLVMSGEYLYLLYEDGHTTKCVFNSLPEAPTRCTDPTDYIDERPGRESGPQIPDARFLQVLRTSPPEASIFMLDPNTRAIYHFSLNLKLVYQYRALNSLPERPATAFAISPNRQVFLALGNQVFIADLPQ